MTLEKVYDLYVDKVYKFFFIKSLDTSTAEDLTSQTFIVLLERMQHDHPPIDDHKKFLYGVMRNVWLMYLRKKYQQNEQHIADIDNFEAYVDEEVGEYTALTMQQRAQTFIARLPERQREVVALRLIEERSIKDIAAYLQKDRNYVKTTYKRGLKRLRALIDADPSAAEWGKEGI